MKKLVEDTGPSHYMEVEQFAKPSCVVTVGKQTHKELTDLAKNFRQNVELISWHF